MNELTQDIHWYPGHMAKAKRRIIEALPNIDMVIELLDARAPLSSRNPDFKEIFKNKPVLTLLTKSNLADRNATAGFLRALSGENARARAIDCKTGYGIKDISASINELMAEKLARDAARGIKRPVRAMVAGITNVGKSTFINTLCGQKKAAAADKPGVTRQNARVSVPSLGIELTDTPGLLWHKFDDREVGIKLACLGSINDDILDVWGLALELLNILKARYPQCVTARYGVPASPEDDVNALFESIAKKRGFIRAGGVIDEERAASVILDEFRAGKIGQITLDRITQ
ncbi:MAG: ribosome biogenesis GTPase YlqF [Clostridia bacterium]|nr:ribosome biogenesis GTPase YlqF [Clostridia bacterium]